MKISDDILSTSEKSKVLKILTLFPESRRILAIYGFYEIGKSAKSPLEIFTKDDVSRILETGL